jgi:hypothetical protein
MKRERRMRAGGAAVVGGLVLAWFAAAPAGARQGTFNAHDDYTEYHLLDPSTHQFHIVYYLNQRQAGATTLLNQTRSGSEGSDISVSDPQTGRPLKFEYRSGAELAAAGESGRLAAAEHYIRAFLARPVPEGGEGRVRIEKTYLDEKSYYTQGEDVVFARSLGIGRNAVILPRGYVIASSNVAAQVVSLPDGRIKIVFENVNTYAANVSIRGRRSALPAVPAIRIVERAFDFAKTLYDLGDPAAREIVVRHEYVETRIGSRATPEFFAHHRLTGVVVTDMDSGKPLVAAERTGVWTIDLAAPIARETESAHIRIAGREIDPGYQIAAGQLQWQKTLREPRTTILLPAGWELTTLTTPATVTTTRDGRVAVQVYNPRIEPTAMALRAARVRK